METNRRILIVDDNPSIHADFKKLLCPDVSSDDVELDGMEELLFGQSRPAAAAGYKLDSAFQGEQALEKVRTAHMRGTPYALAFVDIRMPPGWDGVETIDRVREVCPEIQIVICTAYSDYSWENLRAKAGRIDNLVMLRKPFRDTEVRQLAHELTHKWDVNYHAGRGGDSGPVVSGVPA